MDNIDDLVSDEEVAQIAALEDTSEERTKWKSCTRPNPGSSKAVERGCTCPVIDNHYGKGYMGKEGLFIHTGGCPLHDGRVQKNDNLSKQEDS